MRLRQKPRICPDRFELGRPVALRLWLSGGRAVTLVADDRVFSNRAVRATDAGPFALRLVAGRYRRILIDEYHQGFGPSGSLLRPWTLARRPMIPATVIRCRPSRSIPIWRKGPFRCLRRGRLISA